MTDGKIFHTNSCGNLVVNYAVNNGRQNGEQNDEQELHLRLYRNGRFYAGVRIVIQKLEIFVFEVVNVFYRRV